jgi:hypothetical protein
MRSLSQPTGTFFQQKGTYSQLIPCVKAGTCKSTGLTDNVFLVFQIKTLYPYGSPKQTLRASNLSFKVRYSYVCSPLLFLLLSFHISIFNIAKSFSCILHFVSTLKSDGHYFKNIPLLPLAPLKLRLSYRGSAGYYPLPQPSSSPSLQ